MEVSREKQPAFRQTRASRSSRESTDDSAWLEDQDYRFLGEVSVGPLSEPGLRPGKNRESVVLPQSLQSLVTGEGADMEELYNFRSRVTPIQEQAHGADLD